MKRTCFALVILAVACASAVAAPAPSKPASAAPGLFELGLFLGEPTGLSVKYYFDRKSAVEGVVAWAFSQGFLVAGADYLLHFPDVAKVEEETFPLFVGVGAIVRIDMGGAGGISVGARFPLGALYLFRGVPLEISLELVPGLYLFPDTAFLAMGGVGVRYRF
jgi:hypothetical protein